MPARLRTDRDFGDTAAIDLFVLADYEGKQLSFFNILDLASTFGVVAMIPSKHPKIVWDHFFEHWITPFGVPRRLIYDQGGEFEREFGQELEDLGCEPMPTAAITPQQNAVCERHGGIWKTHARRLLDEFSVKCVPEQLYRVTWLTAAVTWACNSAINDSGYSPAQWVLGRGLRLPYTLLDQTERLSLHERVTRDRAFSERIAMMSAKQRSITSLRYDRALSRAVLARSRAHCADPARPLFQIGEATERQSCTLAWPCNDHWSATRVAVVGTSNNDSEVQQGSPVPPGREMQASEDLFMDLDEQPSKRPRDTPSSSTQQSDFDNPDEFVQRARNVSVPLPRTPEQLVPAPETPFQPVPHGNVVPETPQLSVPSTPPFQFFPGGEAAPVTPRVENSKIAQPATSLSVPVSRPMPSTFAVPSTLPADPVVTSEVPSTLLSDSVVAHSHADAVVAHDHIPTQFDEESAVDTQSDDPFQFDDPPVPAPVIHHRDDLPQHIRTQLQSRIRKPAQNIEPDAKRLRLDAGKRAVLLLSHDVFSGPECCKPVTIFKSCENSGCADVLLTRRAANKEVQYDALVKSQQVRVDAAMVREWDKWNEFGVSKFLSKKQLNDIMKRNPDQKIVGTRWVFTEKTIQGKPDYKARLVVQGCQEDKGYIRTDAPTGSRDAFFMTLSAASQSDWDFTACSMPSQRTSSQTACGSGQ